MMRRFWLCLSAASFLAFTGLQAAHYHELAPAHPCGICVLASQSVRHAPSAAPTFAKLVVWERVAPSPAPSPLTPFVAAPCVRAPPSA